METIDAIKNRKSIRCFQNKKISKKILKKILNTARFAPSAKNRQPWLFVVAQGEVKDSITSLMRKILIKGKRKTEEKIFKKESTVGATINVINQCPSLVLVFRQNDNSWIEGDYISIGTALQNICLSALDYGVSTLIIRDICYSRKQIAKQLNLKNMDLAVAIALGYSTSEGAERYRKKFDDIVKFL